MEDLVADHVNKANISVKESHPILFPVYVKVMFILC